MAPGLDQSQIFRKFDKDMLCRAILDKYINGTLSITFFMSSIVKTFNKFEIFYKWKYVYVRQCFVGVTQISKILIRA